MAAIRLQPSGACSAPEFADPDEDLDWIDQVIGAFCRWRAVDDQFREFWKLRPAAEEQAD